MKPLVIPPAAQRDENAVQMLSAWIAEHGQHCTIKVGMWEGQGRNEALIWGMFLADTIRHIANALQENYGQPVPETISAILAALHEELGEPTSPVEGNFADGHN
ncbi:MAG: DUF5076 domain-containing protein [Roseateles sp.]|uniref:DUF5076 domain-containing protein n=1 Tax=Roseateles sp. TaxID=1971397 RepID=UPI0040359926